MLSGHVLSIVSIVGWSMQARMSTPRTSAAAHEVAIRILTLGFRDQGDSGLAGAGVPLAGRMWAETCLPMIIQPDDGADTWLLCLSAKLPSVGKRSSAARASRHPSCC